jgi:hypothetical protein
MMMVYTETWQEECGFGDDKNKRLCEEDVVCVGERIKEEGVAG